VVTGEMRMDLSQYPPFLLPISPLGAKTHYSKLKSFITDRTLSVQCKLGFEKTVISFTLWFRIKCHLPFKEIKQLVDFKRGIKLNSRNFNQVLVHWSFLLYLEFFYFYLLLII